MSKRLLSGHNFEKINEEEAKDMGMDFFIHGLVRILPEGWLYPASATTVLDKIQTMKFRSDDVIVMTFPKCGTTWMQEILWTMLHNPNLDNPEADEALCFRSLSVSNDMMFDLKILNGMVPELYRKKFEKLCFGKRKEDGSCLQLIEVAPSPRILKCHFPLSLLPKNILDKTKVVYITRNPKDMAVSYFYFFNVFNTSSLNTNMEKVLKSLMADKALFGPFWPHVKEAWQKRRHPNFHFVFYEDMKADIMVELRKLNEFLGTQLSQETLEAVARHNSFSAMKSRGEPYKIKIFERDDDYAFFRQGVVGDWKNNLSPEQEREMNQWTKENLANSDLSLSWALAH